MYAQKITWHLSTHLFCLTHSNIASFVNGRNSSVTLTVFVVEEGHRRGWGWGKYSKFER